MLAALPPRLAPKNAGELDVLSAFLVDYPSSDAYQSLLPHFLPMEPPSSLCASFFSHVFLGW
ncbi:hypothetical protein HN51_029483 [Arachis hypogaea]